MKLPRRAFLRGAGAALALPLLEAMTPLGREAGAEEEEREPPRRLLVAYVPNGVHVSSWRPAAEGPLGELPPTLAPLAPFRERLLVLSGLALEGAKALGDGPGDHARALAAFLTTAHPRKTDGADLRCGVSVDQVAARRLGRLTRLASLELGCERSRQAGACDSGYSCAYSSNLAWGGPATPLGKETNPRLVYERLFGWGARGPAERARRQRRRRALLDGVLEEARALRGRLGRADRAKLDEYLTSVRAVERRIEAAEALGEPPPAPFARPAGAPEDRGEYLRLMADLAVLALATDQTRVVTFLVANEGSGRTFPELGVKDGHHAISHHGGDAEKQEQVGRIDRFHVEALAHLLGALAQTREGEGDLLERTAVLYGSGIADGNRHDHEDLPILLAGGCGGRIAGGRHLRLPRGTPLGNLHLGLLHALGVAESRFGDSTGALPLS